MASDLHTRFHETWLGMVQPVEGLVVSVPVLVEAQCMERLGPDVQHGFRALCPLHDADTNQAIDEEATARSKRQREELEAQKRGAYRRTSDLAGFLEGLLGWTSDLYDTGEALPENLSRYISEGHQTIRPTLALRRIDGATETAPADGGPDIETPESEAGKPYVALVWELPDGLAFDKPETQTGEWRYPPAAKFDRLLRATRVPIGLLSNGRAMRLVYAPHGEATGAITFDLTDMGEVGGRPILDAFVMLLSAQRFFGVSEDDALPALLRRSRERQANVTNTLAGQVFEALDFLLQGFEAAAHRDSAADLRALLELAAGDDPDTRLSEDDHVYGGLLTVLLRLVFLLYAEDRELLPTDSESYVNGLSLSQLFEDLQRDHGAFPDTMNRRFGAWPRVLALFRTIYDGVEHGEFHIPRRRGELFDPTRFPFLESWQLPDTAVAKQPLEMAAVAVPTVDDETVYRVLERLMILEGQRLSYKVLDVEQIGSVYEALMGYGVVSLGSAAVCCRHKSLQSKSRGGVWIEASAVLAQKPANRSKFLSTEYDVVKGDAKKVAKDLKAATDEAAVLDALERISLKKVPRRAVGQLALQPGEERRRTSSHYTPRSLSEPIVRRTIEPLLMAMSDTGEPSSEQLLSLKICDPAMGSGAFLVETCRFLADHVVAAWEREGQTDKIASAKEDVVVHARRLVAQKCLYGVDKNPFAVSLAKLSLWLVTLAREEPFTFVDHCLRHGDSLVGLSYEQIKAFHWKPEGQMDFIEKELEACIEESLALRQQILDLAGDSSPGVTQLKEQLLWDAMDAQERVRVIGDLVVGAFFEHAKKKDREAERTRRLDAVRAWLADGGHVPADLVEMSDRIRRRIPVFHWWVEFPEVFHRGRADPLDELHVNEAALMDAFLGNPPFMGGAHVSGELGDGYRDWLKATFVGSHGNADLVAYFFRHGADLLGAHGTIGFIATNTIAQGDTRTTGLAHLLQGQAVLYDASENVVWPGAANVVVSTIHVGFGRGVQYVHMRLNGTAVSIINSRLRPRPERAAPKELSRNKGYCSHGMRPYGVGFQLTAQQREQFVSESPTNSQAIFPYLGGRELNSNPDQSFETYTIWFADAQLDDVQRSYPQLLAHVRATVKTDRDKLRDTPINRRLKEYWWRFWTDRPELKRRLESSQRCIVATIVTKHLCFSFSPANWVFNSKICVFPFEGFSQFGVLQSRIHGVWAWLLSSTLKNDLNYAPSDCFRTFPFPSADPSEEDPGIRDAADTLYEFRRRSMLERDQGLTTIYNQLKDPGLNDDPDINRLRQLHIDMDRAVLAAYGWPDIEPPLYTDPVGDDERCAKEAFEDEVIDRLFSLNAQRAAEERALGLTSGNGKLKAKKKKVSKPRKKKSTTKQLSLTPEPSEDAKP